MKGLGQSVLITALSVGAFATTALGEVVKTKRDWSLSEQKTSKGDTHCIAYTSKSVNKTNFRLEVSKKAGGLGPLEVFVVETGKNLTGNGVRFAVNGDEARMVTLEQNGDSAYHWMLPEDSPALVERLKNDNDNFKVFPIQAGKVKRIRFSVRGATTVLEEMENRCNGGMKLGDTELAGLVDHTDSTEVNAGNLTTDDISTARGYYFQIYRQLKGVNGIKGELKQLASRYQTFIDERSSLSARQSSLQNSIIPGIITRRSQTRTNLAQQESDLKDTKAAIPPAEVAVENAQERYDDAEAAIAPHRPRHNSLSNVVDRAQSTLSSLEWELENNDSTYRQNERDIASYEDEADGLYEEMEDLREDIRPRRERLRRLNERVNNFNKQARVKRKLDEEPGFRDDQRKVRKLNGDIAAKDKEISAEQGKLNQARADLRACKKSGEEGKDCSAEQEKVNNIQETIGKKRQHKQALVAERRPIKTRVDNTRNRVTREVDTRYDNLVSERNTVRRRVNRLQDSIDSKRSKYRRIVNITLPDLRSDNDALADRRPILLNEITTAEFNLSDAIADLSDFDNSVGYASLEAEWNSSRNSLSTKQRTLSGLINTEDRLERAIINSKNLITQLNSDEATARAEVSRNSKRLGELNNILADYDRERAPIEVRLADAESVMNATSASYTKSLD